jgi:hypothetical protein
LLPEPLPTSGSNLFLHIQISPNTLFLLVPGAGLEPARPYGQGILSPLRLPISPPGQGGMQI